MFILENSSWTILLLAFATGLMHALDADHIMAVSAISAKRGGAKAIVRLCLNWSMGHGVTLLFFGGLILLFGLSIPHSMSHYAELGVAGILMIIGSLIFRDLYKDKAHLHFHRHDDLNPHAHWHSHVENENKHSKHDHNHSAVLVGVVHGLAGLAPLLAVLPVSNQPLWLGIVYLFVFCLGVFIAMAVFGGLFSKVLCGLQRYGKVSMNLIRGMIAMASIFIGMAWLVNGLQ
jgi:ABC-type nickel/cobalt efflux system permease component RcnA